jgi:preprotein translocase subunit SecD
MAVALLRILDGRRHLAGAVLLVALTVGLLGCTSETADPTPPGETAVATTLLPVEPVEPSTPVDIQLRPVLALDVDADSDADAITVDCTGDGGAPAIADPATTGVPSTDGTVTLPGCDQGTVVLYELGPIALDGSAFESATASQVRGTGDWVVSPRLAQGPTGIDAFNALASRCFAKDESCPTGQFAIVVDGVVITAPAIVQPTFEADSIQVSGNFTEASATALAAGIDAAG